MRVDKQAILIIHDYISPLFVRLCLFYVSVILLVIESTLSGIFLLLTNRGLISVMACTLYLTAFGLGNVQLPFMISGPG